MDAQMKCLSLKSLAIMWLVVLIIFKTVWLLLVNNLSWQVPDLGKGTTLSNDAPNHFVVFEIMKESVADG